jgi:hypothetical protein
MLQREAKAGEVSYAGVIKKIDDVPTLRMELEAIFDGKSHAQISEYGLRLGRHILEIANTEPCGEVKECFEIIKRWQNGETGKGFAKFQAARQAAFKIHRLAREEKDPVKVKVLRVMGQIAATPHVKRHALIASDYAVKLINMLYPKDMDAVKKEREVQIELMKCL